MLIITEERLADLQLVIWLQNLSLVGSVVCEQWCQPSQKITAFHLSWNVINQDYRYPSWVWGWWKVAGYLCSCACHV